MTTPSEQGARRSPAATLPMKRKVVCSAGGLLFALWLGFHFRELTVDQHGIIRFFIAITLALLILFRSKPVTTGQLPVPFVLPLITVAMGVAMVLASWIEPVRSVEWLGMLLILLGALGWALPRRALGDTWCAMALLYWIHPLPGPVFDGLAFQMQQASVLGAERLLHCVNSAAWADGPVIRAGLRAFEINESCSGMKTAIAVLLFSFGLGVLRRMRAGEIAGLILVGLMQVLLLNIIRIALLVKLGATRPVSWAPQALHDTGGVFLLLAVVGVAAEAAAWQYWRERRQRRAKLLAEDDFVGEPEDKAHRWPVFWQWLGRWWLATSAGLLLAGVAAGVIYKGRPNHRARMILRVAQGLERSSQAADWKHAERAVQAALALDPGNPDLGLARIRILYLQDRFAEMLEHLTVIPVAERTAAQWVMKARALFLLQRPREAMEVLAALPPALQNAPEVAMFGAELAAHQDQLAMVCTNILCAARAPGLAERVRDLFPYLAVRDQWQTILNANPDRPYRKPEHALTVINANLRLNKNLEASAVLRQALALWPDNPLFLDPLMALTLLNPGSEWEQRFNLGFEQNLDRLSRDDLARFLNACLIGRRPDLAWQAYRRLACLDPRDPALFLAPALHADDWFVFRRHWLGLQAASPGQTIDLREFCRLTRALAPWDALWREVPLVEEILADEPAVLCQKYLDLTLAELRRREAAGPLPVRLQKMYPRVLARLGRRAEAQEELTRLEAKHAGEIAPILVERAHLYIQDARWAEAYELLREVHRSTPSPPLGTRLMYAQVLRQLDLDALAMLTLDEARQALPGSEALDAARSAMWNHYGCPEEALFVLSPVAQAGNPLVTARLLYRTERIQEARRLAGRAGLKAETFPDRQQNLVPVPAEWAMQWTGEPLRPDDYDRELAALDQGPDPAASPYPRALQRLQRDWLRVRGTGGVADPTLWKLAGRDEREKAQALAMLAILLARQGNMDAARTAIREAATRLPDASLIERLHVALSGGDPEVIRVARRHCPEDPEIWLAALVSRRRGEPKAEWVLDELRAAAAARSFSPGTFVRAGDYLLRQGLVESAAFCAQEGLREGRGLLPAYVLGIRCALAQTNHAWALTCTVGALENAVEPWPLYPLLVDLKIREEKLDVDLIQALEQLVERFPQDIRWRDRLGRIYFQRGEMGRALEVLEPVITQPGGEAHALLLAAEAARHENGVAEAIAMLKTAAIANPEDVCVLNNLVYYLAQTPETQARAEALAPKLVAAEPRFELLDTLALVHFKSGNIAKAAEYVGQALKRVKRGDYGWHDVYLHAAEINLAQGSYAAAREMVAAVRQDSRRSAAAETQARDILERIPDEK